MDVERYRQILQQCFPDLTVSSIEFVGGGTFRVFEVNGDRVSAAADVRDAASVGDAGGCVSDHSLIFRFPHGGDGSELLRRERRVCECLNPILPLPIPRYEYFSGGCRLFDGPVAGYHKLPGVTLQDCEFHPATLRGVAAQLGEFLSALHSIRPEVLQVTGLPSSTPAQARERQRASYAEIGRHAFALLTPQEQAWTEALFERFLADEANWQFEPALVHGDFDASNVLCEPVRGDVVGVLDFEEARVGDPAWDFCALQAEYGSAFLGDLLADYCRPLDAGFMQRVVFHARRILFHELLYGIQENEQRFIEHGLARLRRAMAGQEPIGDWLAASTSEVRRL